MTNQTGTGTIVRATNPTFNYPTVNQSDFMLITKAVWNWIRHWVFPYTDCVHLLSPNGTHRSLCGVKFMVDRGRQVYKMLGSVEMFRDFEKHHVMRICKRCKKRITPMMELAQMEL